MMDISIIIVTYNSEEDIERCLDSLLGEDATKIEIIIVDNASKDRTKEILKQYKNKIKVVYNKKNLGYAEGNNTGFENSRCKYIFLLNPDTKVLQGGLKKMFDYMEKNKGVIIIGPLLLNSDRTIQSSLRRFPDFRILFFELTGLSRIFPSSKIFNRWRMPDFDYKEVKDVEQPMAAALFLRKSFFKDEFMDKRFSMFFNDVDLCIRVKKKGGMIVFFPEASVIHTRGKSTAKVKEKMIPLHTKGLLRFFVKQRNSFSDKFLFILFLPWIMLNTILRVLLLRFFSKDF